MSSLNQFQYQWERVEKNFTMDSRVDVHPYGTCTTSKFAKFLLEGEAYIAREEQRDGPIPQSRAA